MLLTETRPPHHNIHTHSSAQHLFLWCQSEKVFRSLFFRCFFSPRSRFFFFFLLLPTTGKMKNRHGKKKTREEDKRGKKIEQEKKTMCVSLRVCVFEKTNREREKKTISWTGEGREMIKTESAFFFLILILIFAFVLFSFFFFLCEIKKQWKYWDVYFFLKLLFFFFQFFFIWVLLSTLNPKKN